MARHPFMTAAQALRTMQSLMGPSLMILLLQSAGTSMKPTLSCAHALMGDIGCSAAQNLDRYASADYCRVLGHCTMALQ